MVATPIGNLEDVTTRALRVLREVAVVAAEDTRRTAKLLNYYGISTRTTSLYAQNERRRLPALLTRLDAGHDVALVTDAGTPTVSDPGAHLIAAAAARGIRVTPIPGPSAIISALSCSGFSADRFTFRGFPPRKSKARLEWLRTIAANPDVSVFFEAPHRVQATLVQAATVLGDRPIVVARELTKAHEQVLRGPIGALIPLMSSWLGEFTIVVGPETRMDSVRNEVDYEQLWLDVVQLTKTKTLTRREAIAQVAMEAGKRPNELSRFFSARRIGRE